MTRKSIDNLLNDACILRRNCDFLLRDARNDGYQCFRKHPDGNVVLHSDHLAALAAARKEDGCGLPDHYSNNHSKSGDLSGVTSFCVTCEMLRQARKEAEIAGMEKRDDIEHGRDICEIEFWLKVHSKEQRDQLFELLRNPLLPDMPAIRAALAHTKESQ